MVKINTDIRVKRVKYYAVSDQGGLRKETSHFFRIDRLWSWMIQGTYCITNEKG